MAPHAHEDAKEAAIRELLTERRLLLVLDNLESLQTGAGHTLTEEAGRLLASLVAAAERGRGAVVITGRYPVPEVEGDLRELAVPSLTRLEQRKLMWRLPAMKGLPAAEASMVLERVGGHPRLLELTDALLGGRRQSDVVKRLRTLSRAAGASSAQAAGAEEAVTRARALAAAADVVLGELIEQLTPAERAGLAAASVYHARVPDEGVEAVLGAVADGLEVRLAEARERLGALTLVEPGAGWLVHRWTADWLHERLGVGAAHHEAAARWLESERPIRYERAREALEHWVSAGRGTRWATGDSRSWSSPRRILATGSRWTWPSGCWPRRPCPTGLRRCSTAKWGT